MASSRAGRGAAQAIAVAVLALLVFAPSRAPANSVAEQRARLPPPAHCEDEVEGIWRSHKWNARDALWELFTLEIRRKKGAPSELVGRITNRYWFGPAEQSEPPPCRGLLYVAVGMEAAGSLEAGRVEFHGTSWKLEQHYCGHFEGYNLDRFTGQIDPALQEFQSVNNDGDRSVNDPHVFRRIHCFDEGEDAPVERPEVSPPPFLPPKAGGC